MTPLKLTVYEIIVGKGETIIAHVKQVLLTDFVMCPTPYQHYASDSSNMSRITRKQTLRTLRIVSTGSAWACHAGLPE